MLVYEKIRSYMERYGIKQSVVARKCNLTPSTFNAIMNGHRKMYAEDLRNICLALNVSPEVFIEVDNKK